MALVARWAAIWAAPPGSGSVELWDEGLLLDGRDDEGRVSAIRIPWEELHAVGRARSRERLKGLGTLVLDTDGGQTRVAPLECGVLVTLERIASDHVPRAPAPPATPASAPPARRTPRPPS